MVLSTFIIFACAVVMRLFLKFRIEGNMNIHVPIWLRKGFCIVAIGVIGLGLWSCNDDGGSNPISPDEVNSQYNFEDGSMGWMAQDYHDSLACVQVLQSDEHAKGGQYSLKMVMDLIGSDVSKSQGEAWVDMRNNPPLHSGSVPLNLTNRTMTIWVYASQGATGDNNSPNGFQLFVKDENLNSEYGSWHNVVEEQWMQISLTVSVSEPPSGYMDQGFDSSRIVAIGVKMGTGSNSTATYQGNIYLDEVTW